MLGPCVFIYSNQMCRNAGVPVACRQVVESVSRGITVELSVSVPALWDVS